MEPSWAKLGSSWPMLGTSWVEVGILPASCPHDAILEPSWSHLGGNLAELKPNLGPKRAGLQLPRRNARSRLALLRWQICRTMPPPSSVDPTQRAGLKAAAGFNRFAHSAGPHSRKAARGYGTHGTCLKKVIENSELMVDDASVYGDVPTWPSDDPRWPQDGPKMAQDGPRWAHGGPSWAQGGPR